LWKNSAKSKNFEKFEHRVPVTGDMKTGKTDFMLQYMPGSLEVEWEIFFLFLLLFWLSLESFIVFSIFIYYVS
jgi:hypothetical protein